MTDTGHGIPGEALGHLFGPFSTTREPGRGGGLGLPTVRAIVGRCGGFISADTRVGLGTALTVHLPLAGDPPAPHENPDATAATPAGGGHEAIPVPEDEPALRRLVSRTLGRAGYAVLVADSAAAVALWWRTPVDLLRTDVVMTGVNGPELARRLRHDRPGARVVFMSGHAQGT